MSEIINSNIHEDFILVVEDNEDLRELYDQCLTYEGFNIVQASNGKDALEIPQSSKKKPCVILLDLMMPIMDGWQFLQERSRHSTLLSIPIVICSAATENLPPALIIQAKPISKKELINLAKKFCRASKS